MPQTTYRVKKDTHCARCERPDVACNRLLKDIPKENVYKSLKDDRLVVFISDGTECSGLVEVEPETFAHVVEDMRETCGSPLASKPNMGGEKDDE